MVHFAFFNSSKTEAFLGECSLEESLLEYEAIYKRKQQTKIANNVKKRQLGKIGSKMPK